MDRLANNKTSIQKEFVKQYKNEIFPFLKGHEVLRQRLNKKCNLIIAIPLIVAILGILLLIFLKDDGEMISDGRLLFLVFSPGLLVILAYFLCANKTQESENFALDLKKQCLQHLLNAFGDIKWSNDTKIIKNNELSVSELFAEFNKRTVDDEFSGTYKDIKFKVCETTLLKEFNSGKNRSVMKIFSGIVFKFKVPKKIEAHTIVSTKGDLTARDNKWLWLVGCVGTLEPILKKCEDGDYTLAIVALIIYGIIILGVFLFQFIIKNKYEKQKIILEDVKFGKKYHVYSQDQVEARCIVTPAFMEKFLNLRTAYGAKNAKCAFYGDTVMFAISTNKNLFEIGSLNKSLLKPETFKKLYNEIAAIYDIIDYFKLDK